MVKSVRRYVIPLLISIILLSTSAQAIYVHRYEQKYSQWCWAASAQMILLLSDLPYCCIVATKL